mgnify:CR=1 FL=1
MNRFNQLLLFLHFLGLALGFSASFASMVMGSLIGCPGTPYAAWCGYSRTTMAWIAGCARFNQRIAPGRSSTFMRRR